MSIAKKMNSLQLKKDSYLKSKEKQKNIMDYIKLIFIRNLIKKD